jgi:hypothetical protein
MTKRYDFVKDYGNMVIAEINEAIEAGYNGKQLHAFVLEMLNNDIELIKLEIKSYHKREINAEDAMKDICGIHELALNEIKNA